MDANPQSDGLPDLEPVEVPESGYAVRSREEIGGKKFRVGPDDAYVPFRNRKRRRRRTVTAAIGGLLVVGVGAYGLVSLVTAPDQNASAAAACKPGAAQALTARDQAKSAAAGGVPQFTLNVYNSTDRKGLAARTAAELKARGFAIGQVTNDPLKAKVSSSAQVRGAGASTVELQEVAAEVPGAQIQTDSRNDPSIDLVIGSTFSALASASQVNAALHAAGLTATSAAAAAAPTGCAH